MPPPRDQPVKNWPKGAKGLLATSASTTALVALVTHTGMRFGSNLNFALMTIFVFSIFVGALVAGSAGLELRFPNSGATTVKSRLVRIHVLLVSPLPVLLLFHVLSVYYF